MPRDDPRHRDGTIEHRIERLRSLCRERGLSFTHQRAAVLRAVLESDGHPTADAIYGALRHDYPSLSRATVYKALAVLSDLGVIGKIAPPGVARTAALFDARPGRHHHALCRACGRVADVDDTDLRRPRLPRSSGFAVEDFTINFYGVCRRCAGGRANQTGDQP